MIIGIADSQARVRYCLRILLEQQAGWLVGGEAAGTEELLDLLDAVPLDLLLVDWYLPGIPTEILLERLREQHPKTRVIVMGGVETGRAALAAGADGFASKTESPEKLLRLICELWNGRNVPGSAGAERSG